MRKDFYVKLTCKWEKSITLVITPGCLHTCRGYTENPIILQIIAQIRAHEMENLPKWTIRQAQEFPSKVWWQLF